MDLSLQEEQFSRAFVHAVASVAGLVQYRPEADDDSVDVGFALRGGNGTVRSPRPEAQLKCSSQKVRLGQTEVGSFVVTIARIIRGVETCVQRLITATCVSK